jgi:hypothetical protein
MKMAPWITSLAVLVCASLGCRALRDFDDKPAGAGPNSMLDDVAVGQARCPDADGDARPFVVEWDATDLATFEAKASRDLVFVKYEGCEIEMLYGCSDNGVPGRYGAYQSPIFTSGTVESFEMRDRDELYAKLPLGAVSFDSEIAVGQSLELLYFVSGTANSTRNYVERAAIADNGRCEGATHFVSAYNLGAFRLLAHEQAGARLEASAGKAGAGGSSESESTNLKQGGDLDSCKTHGQQHCRVPIRLVLQPIDETSQDLDASAAGAPRPDPEPAEDTVSERADKLRQAAMDKGEASDGAGCLEDLDRADALDDSAESRADSLWIRGLCTMVAGDCKGGEALVMEAIGLGDPEKKLGRLQIKAAVSRSTMYYCVLDQLDEGFRGTAAFERIRKARRDNRPQDCNANAEAMVELIRKRRRAGEEPVNQSVDALYEASACLWDRGDCEAAKRWYIRHDLEVYRGKKPKAEIEAKAEEVWKKLADETGCSN